MHLPGGWRIHDVTLSKKYPSTSTPTPPATLTNQHRPRHTTTYSLKTTTPLPIPAPKELSGTMAPSLPNTKSPSLLTTTTTNDDLAIDAHSSSALASTRRNLSYLYNPSTSTSHPSSRRTRTLLRILRSSLIFAFWRIVRYAKYVAIGSLVATLSAGALGTMVSGVGSVLAPTGIVGTVVAACVWGVGRFAVRRVGRRWSAGEEGLEADVVRRRRGEMGSEEGKVYRGPDAVPW
ncbi:hypothetical protein T440DRAFT_526386 [Plenodomus tracheiphilus IPT5]|uniref:Uncharacterized protein n=1 Tax=Plenodomus tracheiphilus IPT5 TaxID=1408161 RepID=A0A6A7BE09_9PLEO|nr:hypothetical protein T440DRAFT_526386 [Plenodomus tracheiphilus IPT5]